MESDIARLLNKASREGVVDRNLEEVIRDYFVQSQVQETITFHSLLYLYFMSTYLNEVNISMYVCKLDYLYSA